MWALVLLGILGCIMTGIAWADIYRHKKVQAPIPQQPIINVNLEPLQRAIDNLPAKVLQSITGSCNTYSGKLGELVAHLTLRAQYDRVIPLGNIADFLCIRFSKDDRPGTITFLDVKTGDYARLSTEQRALQKLIEEKRIEFIKLKIETE